MQKPIATLIDFITGEKLPDTGAEINRQAVEKLLVCEKGFARSDIEVDADIELLIGDRPYRSQIDLIASVGATRFMLIKCAAGSLGSREREALAAARLIESYQIPLTVVSDGKSAIVLDTASGKKTGEGLDAIPTRDDARQRLKTLVLQPLPAEKKEGEKLIFRTYDTMNVNVRRNIE